MDCSLPGSSVHGIFQARVLEWVAIAFSNVPCRKNLKKYKGTKFQPQKTLRIQTQRVPIKKKKGRDEFGGRDLHIHRNLYA